MTDRGAGRETVPGTAPGGRWRLTAWARALAGLRGWRRQGVAVLLGAISALALPPLNLVVFLIPAFTGLLWLLDGTRRPRQAALVGWSFGFGHMAAGLYWVGIAFLVDAARFGLIMPFAVAGLAAGMALFPALAVYATAIPGWRGPARVVLLATSWLVVEWVRSWIFTGFPWNLMGTVWDFSPAMLQLAAATGVWGLSWLTVFAAAAPAVLAESGGQGGNRKGRRGFVVAAAAAIGLVWAGGALRLEMAPAPGTAVVPDVRLRLVQASIPQALKWAPETRRQNVDTQMQLSQRPGPAPVTHIIWPETAVPYLLDLDPDLRRVLAEIVPTEGLLITGAPRISDEADGSRLWNSLQALDGRGDIVATYDKHHLVPFGEYTPFRGVLGTLKLTVGSTDFSAGPGPVTLALPGLPAVSPFICYEAIYPGQVVAPGERPGWLLNITNDGWFGLSSGPYQHFASARLRGVEEGLPLVRAANSGISAVVDPYGRILGRLELNQIGVLDASLPLPIAGGTPYARLGNWVVMFLAFASLAFTLILRRIFP
jgi:apolipoprotein N-acyltransferase